MAGATSMKNFENNEQVMNKWENKVPQSLNRMNSMEVRMESYPPNIANVGISFERYGGARAIFVITCLLSFICHICSICVLNIHGEIRKLIRWCMNSGDSGTGKSPAMKLIEAVIASYVLYYLSP